MFLEHKPDVTKQDTVRTSNVLRAFRGNHKRFSEHCLVGLQASQDASPLLDLRPALSLRCRRGPPCPRLGLGLRPGRRPSGCGGVPRASRGRRPRLAGALGGVGGRYAASLNADGPEAFLFVPVPWAEAPPMAWRRVISRHRASYSGRLFRYNVAAAWSRGSEKFGSVSSEEMERRTFCRDSTGDHLSFRMSRQMSPPPLTLGWKMGVRNFTIGGSIGYRVGKRMSSSNEPPS
ncbi:unnamed protein product [Prorocentrum cordatum]|uniref:Uncharacterized protein n=1 Tax=Prorocentrum cordatum TaxID=2364126 RepID=A0ABN9V372_9DINO|nr:unnamed protein product [Polarella glacialis]